MEAFDDVDLIDEDMTIPIFSLGVPDIASLELDATFGIHASFDYDIGFGLDGHGFYALAGTPTDPTFGLTFGVTAGVQGQVEVNSACAMAQAGGDIGFSVTPYVALTAAPTSVDPDSDPNKVYLSDLTLFGSDPFTDILDDLSAGIEGDFTGDLYASIDLLFFSLSWNWGIKIPVFNYERSPTWPSPTGSGPGVTPWPNVTQHGGVVTFTGTAAADNVTLTQEENPVTGTDNSLKVTWTNAPAGYATSETFTGVASFVFNGGSGADTLTAEPGLTTPVRAVGGSGNDSFDLRNSSANNTFVAGTGVNTFYGGSGNDLIIGGSNNDTLNAGSGTDTVYGGSGNETIKLGSGHDTFYGSSGNYTIQGGSGTYMIDGGTGHDVITVGAGSHNSIYGGSAGKNTITGASGGYDTIYGGGAGDSIIGGGGHDTIYGSGGAIPGAITNNEITGGPLGFNTIFGGAGGDTLVGGIGGNNTIWAGAGNEMLAGGDGLGLVVNPEGNGLGDAAGDGLANGDDTLIGGSGNDTLFGDSTGHSRLQAGTGNDTLFAGSGGDALIAGLGADGLYGSIGNDTFQLPFTPVGQGQPNDTLLGGGGADTLVLKAESGNGTAGLGVTATAIAAPATSAPATSLTVSNGLPVAADLLTNGSGLVIQIGSEEMLVTAVNGNVLTVERGYNSTTAAPHGNNALVLLPGVGSPLPTPTDYSLYLNQSGSANQYTATLSALRFATTTKGSTTVTGIDSTAGLAAGEAVAGPGIPTGTKIATIASSTSITLTSAATFAQANLPLTFATVGGIAFTLPGSIPNIQLEAGAGNNLIQVDPSVTRDVTTYGGPGYNVLMAGSGNDTLIAGPGTAMLYGGTGDDTLYGGDLPTQDVAPTTDDPARTVTNSTGAIDGNDTLLAGPGDDELIAGSGNDLLIGGSLARQLNPGTGTPGVALLQNGQYQLIEGAGRDILTGGAGNDLLIAGPGSPGEILEAGTGNNTLIAQNYGVNILSGGGGAGHSLLLGGNLENFETSNSSSQGSNTLVGGLGINDLAAGSGSDILYASYNAPAWSQGEAAAAAFGVHVVPPQLFQGDATSRELQTLLEEEQAGTLTSADHQTLGQLLENEFNSLAAQEESLNAQVSDDLEILNDSQSPNEALISELQAVISQDSLVQAEVSVALNQIDAFIGGTPLQPDVLLGGSGDDTFYGNVGAATQMGGGSGNDVFYNYNASDTVQGGSGSNTLILQDETGNNTISLTQDATNVNAADFIDNSDTLLVGDTGHISGIQTLEIQLGSGNDTVTVNLLTLPSSGGILTGLKVLSGTGNDVIDASAFTGQETLVGGAGEDVIKVAVPPGNTSVLTGTPTTELDLEDTDSDAVTLGKLSSTTVPVGLQVGSWIETLSNLGSFGKLVVVGGAASNSFTTDGSIADVVLEGGGGSNTFTVAGGTATLIGGSGTNIFTLNGPGNYFITGNGSSSTLTVRDVSAKSGDDLTLTQSGVRIAGNGSLDGNSIKIWASKLSQVAVYGVTTNASTLDLPFTLFGSGVGGMAANTFLYPAFSQTDIVGGTGPNELVFLPSGPGNPMMSLSFITNPNSPDFGWVAMSNGQAGFIGPLSYFDSYYGLWNLTTFASGNWIADGSNPDWTFSVPTGSGTPFLPPNVRTISAAKPSKPLTFASSGTEIAVGLTVKDPNDIAGNATTEACIGELGRRLRLYRHRHAPGRGPSPDRGQPYFRSVRHLHRHGHGRGLHRGRDDSSAQCVFELARRDGHVHGRPPARRVDREPGQLLVLGEPDGLHPDRHQRVRLRCPQRR